MGDGPRCVHSVILGKNLSFVDPEVCAYFLRVLTRKAREVDSRLPGATRSPKVVSVLWKFGCHSRGKARHLRGPAWVFPEQGQILQTGGVGATEWGGWAELGVKEQRTLLPATTWGFKKKNQGVYPG